MKTILAVLIAAVLMTPACLLAKTTSVKSDDPQLRILLTSHREKEVQAALDALKEDGSAHSIAVLRQAASSFKAEHRTRMSALSTLANIGSKEAIAAIADFENGAATRSKDSFQFGNYDYPIVHFAPTEIKIAANATDAKGDKWAVFWYGRKLRVTKQVDAKKDLWAQPTDLQIQSEATDESPQVSMEIADGKLLVTYKKVTVFELSKLPQASATAEPGGATSGPASRLAKAPTSASTPATASTSPADELAEIRQAVWTFFFATTNSYEPILLLTPPNEKKIKDDFEFLKHYATGMIEPEGDQLALQDYSRQKFIGYMGTVRAVKTIEQNRANITSMTVVKTGPDKAVMMLSDHVGNSAASVSLVWIQKIHGRWVVTKWQMVMIS